MNRGGQDRVELWRALALVLAVFTLGLKLAVPALMPTHGPGFGIPICNGDLVVEKTASPAAPQRQDAPQPPAHDGGCPFAAATFTPSPPPAALVPTRIVHAVYVDPPRRDGPAPGCGLAAPPPPSQGPPLQQA